jgi:hypothetical protein
VTDPNRTEVPTAGDPRRRGDRSPAPPHRVVLRARPAPLGRLLLYYLVLIGLIALLVWLFPVVRHAFLSPIDAPVVSKQDLTGGGGLPSVVTLGEPSLDHTLIRTVTTLLVALGALAIALPVAWVYMFTKRLRYDGSLVQSVIILPVVIAGILMIVKNSLALAFSLAGIVGAVRFRNTLKDPKDAVYIFLAIGLGLASGVQALDIALVLSLSFNLVVLALWKFNVGAIYSHEYGASGILAVGDRRLMVAQSEGARHRVRARHEEAARGMEADGVLMAEVDDPESGRHAVEAALGTVAKEWSLAGTRPGPHGSQTLEFIVKLKKKSTVVELLGELDERWGAQVSAAEFVPLAMGDADGMDDGDDEG